MEVENPTTLPYFAHFVLGAVIKGVCCTISLWVGHVGFQRSVLNTYKVLRRTGRLNDIRE